MARLEKHTDIGEPKETSMIGYKPRGGLMIRNW